MNQVEKKGKGYQAVLTLHDFLSANNGVAFDQIVEYFDANAPHLLPRMKSEKQKAQRRIALQQYFAGKAREFGMETSTVPDPTFKSRVFYYAKTAPSKPDYSQLEELGVITRKIKRLREKGVHFEIEGGYALLKRDGNPIKFRIGTKTTERVKMWDAPQANPVFDLLDKIAQLADVGISLRMAGQGDQVTFRMGDNKDRMAFGLASPDHTKATLVKGEDGKHSWVLS